MNHVNPVEFMTFFADVERFFSDRGKEAIELEFEAAGFRSKFRGTPGTTQGYAANYDAWMHVTTQQEFGVMWKFSLNVASEYITVEATYYAHEEDGDEVETLDVKQYNSFEAVQDDLDYWFGVFAKSMRQVLVKAS